MLRPLAEIPLAHLILALAVDQAHPGHSPYSLELVPECGTDAKVATCSLTPSCNDPGPQCRPPRWSAQRHGWVKMESRATALRRFAGIAESIATTASELASCKTAAGDRLAGCTPVDWAGDERTLALAALTVALHESGLREDVEFGRPPLGRGPAGEACLMQIAPDQAPRAASWIGPQERQQIAKSPRQRELFMQTLLGDSQASLGHCFEIGMRMLARARRSCEASGQSWEYGMFSMYGGGKSCKVERVGRTRSRTFQTLFAAHPSISPELSRLLE
jgi:hypothetical protein